jgi:hypothetical protein
MNPKEIDSTSGSGDAGEVLAGSRTAEEREGFPATTFLFDGPSFTTFFGLDIGILIEHWVDSRE